DVVVSLTLDRLSDQLLVLVRTVDLGRVEEVDSQFSRAMNGGNRLRLIRRAVRVRHAHAAESLGRHGQISKPALFHGLTFVRRVFLRSWTIGVGARSKSRGGRPIVIVRLRMATREHGL